MTRRKQSMVLIGLSGALAVMVSGCTTANPETVAPITKVIANFDFEPPAMASAGAANMNIILVDPQYAPDFAYGKTDVYRKFAESMGKDFEELLTSRGYTVQGPFASYDEIVFSQKERGDLILSADLDIDQEDNISVQSVYRSPGTMGIMLGASPTWGMRPKGDLGVSGKITLKAMEPTTQEKLWVKSVPVEGVRFPVEATQDWAQTSITQKSYMKDPGFHNPTVAALEGIYKKTLAQAYTYLEPRELQQLKPQADRIKSNSRFLK